MQMHSYRRCSVYNKQCWYFQSDHMAVSSREGKDVESSRKISVTVRRWRENGSSGRAIQVEVLVGLVILSRNGRSTSTVRKKQRKLMTATVISRIGSLSLLYCHRSSLLSPPFLSFPIQTPTSSHPLVSSCLIHLPLTHASSSSSLLFPPSSPPHFAFLVSSLSENSHPFTQSFHFSTPLRSFCLELGQLKATEEKKQKQERVCVSHQITTESEE